MQWTEEVARRNASVADRVVKSGFRDPAAAALSAVARDAGGGALAFADPQSRSVEFDPKAARARFVITTPTKDRHGDWVVPEGCKGRLDRYAKNPVVFFGHRSNGFPVGSARDKDGNLAVEVVDGLGAVSDCYFHLKTRESEEVCALVEAGELRAASIGFVPLKGKAVENESAGRGKNGEVDFGAWVSFVFEEWELLEWSVVAVPANPECVSLRLERGIGGRALSEGVANYLRPFAAPAKVWSAGFTPKSDLPPPADPPPGHGEGGGDNQRKKKPKAPHGALTLARLVRRLSDAAAFARGEEPAFDNESAKSFVCDCAAKVEGLRDACVQFALDLYPAVDFAALEVEVPAAKAAELPGPQPGTVGEGLIAAADAERLLAAVKGLKSSQAELKTELRRVTGRVD